MKTAVSLPDGLFREAERAAKRLEVSRSELYALAIAAFLREHRGEAVTDAINRALGTAPPSFDAVLARAQAASLGPDEGPFEEWVGPAEAKGRRKHG